MGSINKESVAAQEAEMGIMKLLVKRPSVKVRSKDTNKFMHAHVYHVYLCLFLSIVAFTFLWNGRLILAALIHIGY